MSVAVGRCRRDCAQEYRCPIAGHTQLSPACLYTDSTAQLKTPRSKAYLGPSCHDAASIPRSVPAPRTRDWTLLTLTLVHFLVLHLSMLTRLLLCAHHVLRVNPSLPHPPGREVRHDCQVPFDAHPLQSLAATYLPGTSHWSHPCGNIWNCVAMSWTSGATSWCRPCTNACCTTTPRLSGPGYWYRPCGNIQMCHIYLSAREQLVSTVHVRKHLMLLCLPFTSGKQVPSMRES